MGGASQPQLRSLDHLHYCDSGYLLVLLLLLLLVVIILWLSSVGGAAGHRLL